MLSFFPQPYPDESLYSVLARYHTRSGNTGLKLTMQELFDSNHAIATADLPCNLDALVGKLSLISKITVEDIVKQMLFTQFTIKGETEFEQYYEFVWKNTKRSCVVLFGNVRELPPASLETTDERWKLVIDYPFDEPGYGPRDDLAKLQSFSESHPAGTKTLCWIPAFFSTDAEKELGTLVLLEHILAGDRFTQYANHLSPQDRQAAKSLLENQRSVLRQGIRNHLDADYGLDALNPNSLDTSRMLELHERFVSLRRGLELKPPVAADLKAAMEHLLDQALHHEFPGAPNFESEVNRINQLEKVYQVVSEAAHAIDGRALVDKTLRSLARQIANPLKLGEMGQDATHFILGQHWKNHFVRKSAEAGGTISVKQLREWIDLPKPMGLPKEVQNLVILAYAEQTSRTFYRQTIPVDVSLKDLPNECELRDQKLPDEAQWQRAVQLTDRLFNFNLSSLLKPSNVTDLETKVKDKAIAALPACQQYAQSLRDRLGQLNLAMDSDRLETALATLTLLEQIAAKPEETVSILATAEIATTESAMADCLANAATLHNALESESWDIFESIGTLSDERQTQAAAIHQSIQSALLSDEHILPLSTELKKARSKAVRLLTQPIPQPPKPPAVPESAPPVPATIAKPTVSSPTTTISTPTLVHGSREHLDLVAAQALLIELQQMLETGDNIQLNISWIIAL
ncbi:MAG: TniQ family protein [Phormidesmis sp. CAN_BIN36]|nr:TniQ family protein [Phormidesmis sp. CAN_BIN36]